MSDSALNLELAELILRVANKDEAAFRLIYDLTSPKILGMTLRIVQRLDLAEDVSQEVYLTIWRTAGSYQPGFATPLGWLTTIVKRRSLDMLRRQAARRASTTEEFDDFVHSGAVEYSADPMEHASWQEQGGALQDALTRLPAKQRGLVCLAFLRELSHAEIASQHQLPLGTVKSAIRSGVQRLQREMNSDP